MGKTMLDRQHNGDNGGREREKALDTITLTSSFMSTSTQWKLHAHHIQRTPVWIVVYSFTGSRQRLKKSFFSSFSMPKKTVFAASLNLIVRPREKRGENQCVIV